MGTDLFSVEMESKPNFTINYGLSITSITETGKPGKCVSFGKNQRKPGIVIKVREDSRNFFPIPPFTHIFFL